MLSYTGASSRTCPLKVLAKVAKGWTSSLVSNVQDLLGTEEDGGGGVVG